MDRTWTKEHLSGDVPSARMGHSSVRVDDTKALVFGGADPSQAYNDLYMLDYKGLSWKKLTPLGDPPLPRYDHSVNFCSKSGKAVLFGGSAPNKLYNDIFLLDTETLTWNSAAVSDSKYAPSSRNLHSAELILDGARLMIIGGSSTGTSSADDGEKLKIYLFDLESCQWMEPPKVGGTIPSNRFGMSCSRNGNLLYFFGGMNDKSLYNDLNTFNCENMTWVKQDTVGSPPTKRTGHSSTLIDDKLCIVGGLGITGPLGDSHTLDLHTLLWEPIASNIEPRINHSAINLSDKVCIIGGADMTKMFRFDFIDTIQII